MDNSVAKFEPVQPLNENVTELEAPQSSVSLAFIKSISNTCIVIETERGAILKAVQALSCFVSPQVGDKVLYASADDGQAYVLGIVDRRVQGETSIEFKNDVKMTVPNGKMEIIATEGMTLGTTRELELVAQRVGLSAEECEMVMKQFNVVSDHVFARLSDVKLFSKSLQSVIESAVQQFSNRYTKVEGLEQVKAGSIKQVAKAIFSMRSKFGFMRAEKNMKIDGKQIFMG